VTIATSATVSGTTTDYYSGNDLLYGIALPSVATDNIPTRDNNAGDSTQQGRQGSIASEFDTCSKLHFSIYAALQYGISAMQSIITNIESDPIFLAHYPTPSSTTIGDVTNGFFTDPGFVANAILYYEGNESETTNPGLSSLTEDQLEALQTPLSTVLDTPNLLTLVECETAPKWDPSKKSL